jgi:hypothetical protein
VQGEEAILDKFSLTRFICSCVGQKIDTLFPWQAALLQSWSCQLLYKENLFVYTAVKGTLTIVREIRMWFSQTKATMACWLHRYKFSKICVDRTRKNAQVVTNLQQTCSNAVPTTCQQDVFALLAPSLLTTCYKVVEFKCSTDLLQVVNGNLVAT